jgi:hypothetical protein
MYSMRSRWEFGTGEENIQRGRRSRDFGALASRPVTEPIAESLGVERKTVRK